MPEQAHSPAHADTGTEAPMPGTNSSVKTTMSGKSDLGPYIALAAAIAAALTLILTAPLMALYAQSILTQAAIFAIVVLTVDVLWGYTGVLSFAQAVFFGIGAYTLAIVSVDAGFGWGVLASSLAGGAALAMVVAFLLGLVAFHAKADWVFVATVTFAATFAFERLILSGGKFTGASSGISGYVTLPISVTTGYVVCGCALIAATYMAHVVTRSEVGLTLRAIRENERRSQYLGIAVHRTKIILFTLLAGVAAFAGTMYSATQNVVAPDIAGFQLGTMMVVWAAIGGRGSLFGPIGAAIVITYATAYLSGSFPFVAQLILGVIFVLVVTRSPSGLAGIVGWPFRHARRKMGARARRAPLHLVPTSSERMSTTLAGPSAPLLETEKVTKDFGSFRAVDDVTFTGSAGELVSIVGPNGAGKSTFMKCLSDGGFRTAGEVLVGDLDIDRHSPDRLCVAGVGQKFQTASVFDSLTVFECLMVACARTRGSSLWRRSTGLQLPEVAFEIVRSTGLDAVLGEKGSALSHGQKQALELAMVMCTEPSVVLLDEPTAGLSSAERSAIAPVLRSIALDHMKLVILVEHDLDFVAQISSRVLVLHQGKVLLDGTVKEVVGSETVQRIYTGTH